MGLSLQFICLVVALVCISFSKLSLYLIELSINDDFLGSGDIPSGYFGNYLEFVACSHFIEREIHHLFFSSLYLSAFQIQ